MRRHVRWLDFATLTQGPYFKGGFGAGSGRNRAPDEPPPDTASTSGGSVEASAEAPVTPAPSALSSGSLRPDQSWKHQPTLGTHVRRFMGHQTGSTDAPGQESSGASGRTCRA